MINSLNDKTDLKDWDGQSVADISETLKSGSKVKPTDFKVNRRVSKELKAHPSKLIAMDEQNMCISVDGSTVIPYMDALVEVFQAKMIAEKVDVLYPGSEEIREVSFRSALMQNGKMAYLHMSDESFVIIEAEAKKSLPGPRTKSTFSLYSNSELVVESRKCETLVEAIDNAMFEMIVHSRRDG